MNHATQTETGRRGARTLGREELVRILEIELRLLHERVFRSRMDNAFVSTLTGSAKDFLLEEGTDVRYGACHLKCAIDRLLVYPPSNLIATGSKEGDGPTITAMMQMMKESRNEPVQILARAA
jgi:ATP-dependent Clp protease ATP-binding subunit ClpA